MNEHNHNRHSLLGIWCGEKDIILRIMTYENAVDAQGGQSAIPTEPDILQAGRTDDEGAEMSSKIEDEFPPEEVAGLPITPLAAEALKPHRCFHRIVPAINFFPQKLPRSQFLLLFLFLFLYPPTRIVRHPELTNQNKMIAYQRNPPKEPSSQIPNPLRISVSIPLFTVNL